MKPFLESAVLLALIPLLTSCALAPSRALLTNYDQLGSGEVVLVGKVVLTPPWTPRNKRSRPSVRKDSPERWF